MDIAFTYILMHGIGSHEHACRRSIRLGINKLIVVIYVGQQGGARLHLVFVSNPLVG
jgi:hypothetical protein